LFQQLTRLNPDSILALMAKFRADTAPVKVDLGVGVFRDLSGNTPVLACVRRAEQAVLAAQTTKSYVAAAGRAEFNEAWCWAPTAPAARVPCRRPAVAARCASERN
jgi:aspartate aminotransferase